jgi:hypothetical protein
MATSPIDLHWSLTTPEANGDAAKTYTPSQVAALTGNKYFEITDSYLRFTAPVNGFTTAKSTKTRSEFREYKPGTNQEWNWPATGGTHAMGASLVVNSVPDKVAAREGSVYIGQIHVEGGKEPLFKFTYEKEPAANTYKVVASFRAIPGENPKNSDLFPGIAKGARIQYYVKVSSTGKLTAYVQVGEERKNFEGDLAAWLQESTPPLFYFKAGVYNNSTATSTVEDANHSEALFYKLTTTHV